MFGNFLGRFENHYFLSQIGEAAFRQLCKNLGYFLFQHLVTLK